MPNAAFRHVVCGARFAMAVLLAIAVGCGNSTTEEIGGADVVSVQYEASLTQGERVSFVVGRAGEVQIEQSWGTGALSSALKLSAAKRKVIFDAARELRDNPIEARTYASRHRKGYPDAREVLRIVLRNGEVREFRLTADDKLPDTPAVIDDVISPISGLTKW